MFCTIFTSFFVRFFVPFSHGGGRTLFFTLYFQGVRPEVAARAPNTIFSLHFGGAEPPNVEPQKIALSRPGVSETPARWVPSWTTKSSTLEAQVGLHFGGGYWTTQAPQGNFLEAQVAPPKWAPSKNKFVVLVLFCYMAANFFGGRGCQLGGQLGPPKNCPAQPWGFKTPPSMEPNLVAPN